METLTHTPILRVRGFLLPTRWGTQLNGNVFAPTLKRDMRSILPTRWGTQLNGNHDIGVLVIDVLPTRWGTQL